MIVGLLVFLPVVVHVVVPVVVYSSMRLLRSESTQYCHMHESFFFNLTVNYIQKQRLPVAPFVVNMIKYVHHLPRGIC